MTRRRRAGYLAAVGVVAAVAIAVFVFTTRAGAVPDIPTVTVTKGEFVDYLQVRGEIRPAKSIVLAAPMQAGELQIVKLVKNGSPVKRGDVLVEFDGTTLKQRIAEKQSEVKQADAEIAQVQAQQRITLQDDETAIMRAQFELNRAKLDLGKRDTVSRVEYEQAKLAVADDEQKLKEAQQKAISDRTGAEADVTAKRRKREKAQFDLDRAQGGFAALQIKAPADGIVNVMPNYRSGSMFGGEVEFREGDRAWAGAQVVELPDLSSIHLQAHLDESDRGRLNIDQPATVKIEAVPGKDFVAKVELISVLAKADFSQGWPPPKNFDLGLVLEHPDPKIRPGMTAVARIAIDRLPNALIAPDEAVFQRNGRPVVYRLHGTAFDEMPIDITRRGREQVAIASGVTAGDKLATRRPDADQIRRPR